MRTVRRWVLMAVSLAGRLIAAALLRAYNKATGTDAGTVFMPASQSGSPMTSNGEWHPAAAINAEYTWSA